MGNLDAVIQDCGGTIIVIGFSKEPVTRPNDF
jgi:hypothetical protein